METLSFKDCPKFVISLKKRLDRRLAVYQEFRVHCMDDVLVWYAVDAKNIEVPVDSVKNGEPCASAVLACAASHLSLIKHVKQCGDKFVVVFEDDVILADDFWERLSGIENLDWDMFYLGGHWGKPEDITEVSKNIYRMNNVGGTYAYILRGTVYDYILDNYSTNFGMDEFYASQVQPRFLCLGFVPFPVGHLDGYSDVSGSYVSYPANKYFQKEKYEG